MKIHQRYIGGSNFSVHSFQFCISMLTVTVRGAHFFKMFDEGVRNSSPIRNAIDKNIATIGSFKFGFPNMLNSLPDFFISAS